MRSLPPLVSVWLGGPDVHVAVDLPAVGVDDLGLKALGQGDSQPGLACCGGTNDGYQGL